MFKLKKKEVYKVLWSYEDFAGIDSGVQDIVAPTEEQADEIFRQNNKMLYTEKGGQVIRNASGYVVEGVYTLKEWQQNGCPTHV